MTSRREITQKINARCSKSPRTIGHCQQLSILQTPLFQPFFGSPPCGGSNLIAHKIGLFVSPAHALTLGNVTLLRLCVASWSDVVLASGTIPGSLVPDLYSRHGMSKQTAECRRDTIVVPNVTSLYCLECRRYTTYRDVAVAVPVGPVDIHRDLDNPPPHLRHGRNRYACYFHFSSGARHTVARQPTYLDISISGHLTDMTYVNRQSSTHDILDRPTRVSPCPPRRPALSRRRFVTRRIRSTTIRP